MPFNRPRLIFLTPALALLALAAPIRLAKAPPQAKPGPRLSIAGTEMQTLAEGLETSAAFTLFYVSLESLNDLGFSTNPAYDFINNQGGAFVMRPERGLFDPARLNWTIGDFADIRTWPSGGFVIFQPGTTQLGPDPYDRGSPLDPWGTPYLLFSPHGLVRGDSGAVTNEFYGDRFDRYAIVSLGPDGVMSSDDLVRRFNGGVSSLGLSSIEADGLTQTHAPSGTTFHAIASGSITLRGYLFGPTQSDSRIMFGARELTQITSWASNRVSLNLPPDLSGQQPLTIVVSGSPSNALQLNVPLNAAQTWTQYD